MLPLSYSVLPLSRQTNPEQYTGRLRDLHSPAMTNWQKKPMTGRLFNVRAAVYLIVGLELRKTDRVWWL